MEDQKSLLTLPGSKDMEQVEIEDVWTGSPRRRWEVGFDYKNKAYLTSEERKYFLERIAEGAVIVQIGDLTLTNKFKYIIPIHDDWGEPKKIVEVKDELGKTTGFKEV